MKTLLTATALLLITTISLPAQSLTYTESNAIGTLNPYLYPETSGNANRVFSLIYERLFRYDYNQEEYVAELARSFEELEDNTYRIELRNDVFWHGEDQQRFTSRDVVFTYNYIMNRANFAQLRNWFRNSIVNVTASGEYAVTFQFANDVSDFQMLLDTWIIPSHLFNTDTFEPIDPRRNIAQNPVGTGKYKFASRRSGVIEFEVNNRHYLSDPAIRVVQNERIPDVDSRINRLLTGQSDLLVRVPAASIPELEANQLVLQPYQTYTITAIGFNFENSILSDRRIRHAITFGTDRGQILETWYDNRGHLLAGPFTRNSAQINSELQPYAFNPEMARQLLRQAGFTDSGNDGILRNSNGQRLEFNMLVRVFDGSADQTQQNVIREFQRMMQSIGIRINIESRIEDVYLNDRQNGNFDLIYTNLTFDPNYDIRPFFHSDEIGADDTFNFIGYSNSEIDMLFDRALRETDDARRRQHINRIQTVLSEDAPYMFMFSVNNHAAHHMRFVNVNIDPMHFFTNLDQWRIAN